MAAVDEPFDKLRAGFDCADGLVAAPDHPGRLILVGCIVHPIVQIDIDIRQRVVDAGRGHPPGVGRGRAHASPAVAGAE